MLKLQHHSLVAWQRADDLFLRIHRLASGSFPPGERFELGSQIRRAAYSVAANIVVARRHRRDRLRFLNIAEYRSLKWDIACTPRGVLATSPRKCSKTLNSN
jgi:23S rRNA-intervening sequence protein